MSGAIHKCTDRFVETAIDDEVVLMDLESADFFSLTGPSFDIWQLIDGTNDASAIAEALAAEYEADCATIGADVDQFLADMLKAGFVRRA